jgi:hypothetical protein
MSVWSNALPTLEKSSTYFALLAALGKSGCAVCRIVEEASTSYLDTLFYEQVADVAVRRKLRLSRGLCNWHSWRVKDIPTAAFGVAIIAQDLLEEERARLADLQPRLRWPRPGKLFRAQLARQSLLKYLRGWLERHPCSACQAVAEHERHALETLVNFIHEEQFARHFEASFGVCLPHLVKTAAGHASHPDLRILIELQRGKHAQLVADLQELCRKHDYRYSHQAWSLESDAWLRAIEVLAGKPGVFGNDLQWRQAPRRTRFMQSLRKWWR